MTNKPKPDGWFRQIPQSNTGVFKRLGIPFGLFVNLTFGCMFIGGWFEQYIAAVVIFCAGLAVARHITQQDDRWWAILVEQAQASSRRWTTNRFRSFKHFLDT